MATYMLGVYKLWLSYSSSFGTCTFDLWAWVYCEYPPLDWKKAYKIIHNLNHHLSPHPIGVDKPKLHLTIATDLLGVFLIVVGVGSIIFVYCL